MPSDSMFLFHDKTQYVRVAEFTNAITSLHIPPVYAAHFNFGIGYPVFLFYAPVAYWITALIHILGFGVVNAVRLSMLAALLVGAWGMYAWLTKRYARPAAFVGAMLFVSSPWVASEIFVRGNLATIWFLALAPWSLWSLWLMHKRSIAPIFLIPLTLMTHNVLSLLWIPILFVYAFFGFTHKRVYRMKFLILTTLISAVFWIPALTQLAQTYASDIAKLTRYSDHFLCLSQIWTTPSWGFGGSTPGCTADGMSFMLGKLQIMCAILGLIAGSFVFQKKKSLFVEGLIVLWALFLTLPDSAPFWRLLPPLQVIQFPWRFLSIALIFSASLSAAAIQVLIEHIKIVTVRDKMSLNKTYKTMVHKMYRSVPRSWFRKGFDVRQLPVPPFSQTTYVSVCMIFVITIVLISAKYFYGKTVPLDDFERLYTSNAYTAQSAAYEIPEYVPKTVDYSYWQRFRGEKPSPDDITRLTKDFAAFRPQPLIQVMSSLIALSSVILILWLL